VQVWYTCIEEWTDAELAKGVMDSGSNLVEKKKPGTRRRADEDAMAKLAALLK